MGGDDEALEAWQDQEDARYSKIYLEMGNAWRKLYDGAKLLAHDNASGENPEYNALYKAVSDVHSAMNDIESKNSSIDFMGLK